VEIRAEGKSDWANAKSPNKVMKMKAAHGEPLHIRAAGADAEAAVAALVALVDRDFHD
jgi:phosphocarrier protein